MKTFTAKTPEGKNLKLITQGKNYSMREAKTEREAERAIQALATERQEVLILVAVTNGVEEEYAVVNP